MRARWVAKEYKTHARPELHASTPPLETLKEVHARRELYASTPPLEALALSLSLSVPTALTYPVCQSVWALAHSLIGELLAPCRTKLSRCTCSDLVPLERSGLVLALEMEMS